MKINIQAPWEVNPYLKNTIKEKVESFDTYFDGIIHTDVFLKLKERASPKDKTVEMRVSLPGPLIFAEAAEATYEKAVVVAAQKIKTQLVKRKEIWQERHH